MAEASTKLETFVDETIRRAREAKYHPTTFITMRHRYGTIESITRLVTSSEIQSGLKRLHALGLLDFSIEAAAVRFPDEFSPAIVKAAQWRLQQAQAQETIHPGVPGGDPLPG